MPGPTLIKKCSACGKLIEEETMMSGNTCGAVFWTDGAYYAPMLPDSPELVKCPNCKALLWLEELEVVVGEEKGYHSGFGTFLIEGLGPTTAKPYKMPSKNDYFGLLKGEMASIKREFYLRLRAWRAGNDRRRETDAKHAPKKFRRKENHSLAPLSKAEIENLNSLLSILDDQNDEHVLIKAELLRELGFFNRCIYCVTKPFAEEYLITANFIKGLAEKHDPWVREVINLEENDSGCK